MTDEDTRSKFTQLLTECTQQLRHVLGNGIGFVLVLTDGTTTTFNSNIDHAGVEAIVAAVGMRLGAGPSDVTVELP